MQKEFDPTRRHGDGNITLEQSLELKEKKHYLEIFKSICQAVSFNFGLIEGDADGENRVALALKQRFAIGFSNGCPWPVKAITEFIESQESKPANIDQFVELILESGRIDAQHSFLYKKIMQYANTTLRSELQLLKPAGVLDLQEDNHLPMERLDEKLVAGMAYDPVFFDILVPLRNFIFKNDDRQKEAYYEVLDFIISASRKFKSIGEFRGETKAFLKAKVKVAFNFKRKTS